MGLKIKEYLVQAGEIAEALKKIFMGIGVFFFFVIVILIFAGEMTGPRLSIKTFDVPKDLKENGFDGRVLSNHIMDRYYGIYREANTLKTNMGMHPKWEKQDVYIGVGDTGFSPEDIRHLIGYLNTRTTEISGDVVKKEGDGRFQLTLRINGNAFLLGGKTLESIIDKGAQKIIDQTEPYILAHYHWYKHKDKQTCNRILNRILKDYSRGRASLDQHAWAYILKGAMSMEKKDLEIALAYYNKAAALNTRLTLAYRNRATVLRQLNRLDDSLKVCREWIALDGNSWEPYLNLALAHSMAFVKDKDQSTSLSSHLVTTRQAFGRAVYFKKTKDIDYVELLCAYIFVLDKFGCRYEKEKNFKAAADIFMVAIALDKTSENEVLKRTPLQNNDKCYYTDYVNVLKHFSHLLSVCEAPVLRNKAEAEKLSKEAKRIEEMGCLAGGSI